MEKSSRIKIKKKSIMTTFTHLKQGCHFQDNMKFPEISRPRLNSTVSPRPFRGSRGMLLQKSSKFGFSTELNINLRQQIP